MSNQKQSRPKVVLTNRAIVLDKKGKILIIKRSDIDSWRPGYWEFPGGKLDEGQDISNALEREVLEETGLVVIPTNRVVYCESKIGIAKKIGGKVKLSEEHADYAWVEANEALDYKLTIESKKALLVLQDTLPDLKRKF